MENKQIEKKSDLAIKNNVVQMTTVGQRLTYFSMCIKAGILPSSYTNAAQAAVGYDYGIGLGLEPNIKILSNIMVVKGSPSIWGDLPLGLVRKSGELEFINEYLIDKEYNKLSIENKNIESKAFAAVCVIKRKGEDKKEFFLPYSECNASGGCWTKWTKIMMKRRVRSMAIKDVFGDVIGGVNILEYDKNTMPGQEPNIRDVGGGSETTDLGSEIDKMEINVEEKIKMESGIEEVKEVNEAFDPESEINQRVTKEEAKEIEKAIDETDFSVVENTENEAENEESTTQDQGLDDFVTVTVSEFDHDDERIEKLTSLGFKEVDGFFELSLERSREEKCLEYLSKNGFTVLDKPPQDDEPENETSELDQEAEAEKKEAQTVDMHYIMGENMGEATPADLRPLGFSLVLKNKRWEKIIIKGSSLDYVKTLENLGAKLMTEYNVEVR